MGTVYRWATDGTGGTDTGKGNRGGGGRSDVCVIYIYKGYMLRVIWKMDATDESYADNLEIIALYRHHTYTSNLH